MLDIAAAREGYRSGLISDIGFVRFEQNIADALTKKMNCAALRRFYTDSEWCIEPGQWIIQKGNIALDG